MSLKIKVLGQHYADMCADIISKSISGHFVQKLSEYRVSYVKIDKIPILEKGPIEEPDFLLILDTAEITAENLKGLTKESTIIINTQEKNTPAAVKKQKATAILIDAADISLRHTGKSNPVLPVIATLVKRTNEISLKNLELAIRAAKFPDGSIAATEEAHKLVR